MDPLVGRSLGPYDLQARLGAGGMGTVYLAVHRRLRQRRAVKVLPNNLAADPLFVQRFEREARLAAELRHPNIVAVLDVDDADGVFFLAMELLEGRSLRDLVRDDSPIPVDRALHLLEQLSAALDFAHGRGIVHRDVKPGNVFVRDDDHVTLVDFGIARAADGTVLTTSGVMGTPEYMAPEMLRGDGTGQTSDLYALGILTFELLTGRLPFTGTNTPAIMYAQVHTAPPPVRSIRPELPLVVEEVVARQLSKQPEERYPSAGAFIADLRQALQAPDAPGQPLAPVPGDARPQTEPLHDPEATVPLPSVPVLPVRHEPAPIPSPAEQVAPRDDGASARGANLIFILIVAGAILLFLAIWGWVVIAHAGR
jgi:serine/threonine-protein kinase